MPVTTLTSQLVKSIECPSDKKKVDFHDTDCKGLLLEVRKSGGKTFYLRYQDSHGVTRQLKLADVRDITLTQAKKLANIARNKIAMGEDPAAEKSDLRSMPTFEEFVRTRYLPFVQTYKESWKTDEGLLRNHAIPVWGTRYLDRISQADLVELINEHKKTHAPGSCNRLIILLRYVFNLALKWQIPGLRSNPTRGFPVLTDNTPRERYLSDSEAKKLHKAVKHSENTMLQFIVAMLILSGARKREVLDSKWEDFDIEHKSWCIPVSKSGKRRYVPLSNAAIYLLSTIPRRPGCPFVFANPKTLKPYVSIFWAWNTARCRAGMPKLRIHDLRHSFASFLVNGGRSLYEVQKILGHAQIKTTQRYAHLSQESLQTASNAASKWMPVPRSL